MNNPVPNNFIKSISTYEGLDNLVALVKKSYPNGNINITTDRITANNIRNIFIAYLRDVRGVDLTLDIGAPKETATTVLTGQPFESFYFDNHACWLNVYRN